MSKVLCAACHHEIDDAARLCPYCGADPHTGQKVIDTQAILQEVFHPRRVTTTEGVMEFARQRQGVVIALAVVLVATVVGLLLYMFAQKPVTSAQQLIQQGRYSEAVAAAGNDWIHRAEALKLLGRFEEAIEAHRQSDDPAAREGIALSLAHLERDLLEAQRMIEEQIALHPHIQEYQALYL